MRLLRLLSVSCIAVFLFSHILPAQEVEELDSGKKIKTAPISGHLAFSFNTMIGEGHEYVCHNRAIVSHLTWPLLPALSYTIEGALYLYAVHLEGAVSFVQPMATQAMTDKDFFGMLNYPPQQGMTHFSKHNCTITGGINWQFKLGIQFPMPQSALMRKTGIMLILEPLAGVYASHVRWYSSDGYLQYAHKLPNGAYEAWTHALYKIPRKGPAISYKQDILMPLIGLGLETAFPYNLTLSSAVQCGIKVIADTEDIHYTRNRKFIDHMKDGWAVQLNTRLRWQCMPFFSVFFQCFYNYCSAMNGRTAIYKGITAKVPAAYTNPYSAGTSLHGATFSFGCAVMVGG